MHAISINRIIAIISYVNAYNVNESGFEMTSCVIRFEVNQNRFKCCCFCYSIYVIMSQRKNLFIIEQQVHHSLQAQRQFIFVETFDLFKFEIY